MHQLFSLTVPFVLLAVGWQNVNGDDLSQYLQPDDVLSGVYDETYLTSNSSLCTRKCDGVRKTCYYKFHIEQYSTMGLACKNCSSNRNDCFSRQCVQADGIPRGMLTYNRMYPGPAIQVCQGDIVVVDAVNQLTSATTSIHWHGIRQKGTPYSDGVPKVTQCPIDPGNTFRYSFVASEAGTFFYHSHSGLQKVDGLTGVIIVREIKEKEVIGSLYDFDLPSQAILVSDWLHLDADQFFPGRSDMQNVPQSYLVNGRGIFAPTGQKIEEQKMQSLPLTELRVKQGMRYRIRLLGGICLSCVTTVTFFGHNVSIVYADGAGPIIPTTIDRVILNSGDRFDVILEANQPVDTYWIMVRGEGPKGSPNSCNNAQQFALLKYEGHSGKPSAPYPGVDDMPKGISLNPSNSYCNDLNEVCLSQLQAFSPLPKEARGVADDILFVDFSFYNYNSDLFESGTYQPFYIPTINNPSPIRALVNNITNALPPSPLLSQYDDIDEDILCKPECYSGKMDKPCSCANILNVELNSVVDIIISGTGLPHPFHLHGHNFYIMEEGMFQSGKRAEGIDELVRRLEKQGVDKFNPIQKDTVGVAPGGYVVARLIADNPGYWLFHCHFMYHLDSGMSGVLQVGDRSTFPPPPKGYPKCGDFKPSLNL